MTQKSTRSSLQNIGGRAALVADGKRLTAIYSETYPLKMHRRNRQMAKAGVEVFVLIVRGDLNRDFWSTYFWRDDGVYGDESDRQDDYTLDRQAEVILQENPKAYLMVRWYGAAPGAWGKKHPDHLQASETKRLRYTSYASRLAAEGRAEMARRIVKYCESRPWGKRVLGYFPFGQDEGTHNLNLEEAMFDQAPVMQQEFRKFLKKKYATVLKLRQVWGSKDVTFETAKVPTDSAWQKDLERWMHWPEPGELRRYQDYFLLQRELQMFQRQTELAAVHQTATQPIVVATDAYKQPMLGWLHNDAFYARVTGMGWRNILLGSGCFDAAAALDMPELDALITPADYTARSVGFAWEPEGIGDSMVLRGKTIFVEDDARSWATNERETQGAWRNVAECRAGLLRNLALGASRGHFPYWMNVGGGYFDDPKVLEVVKEQIPVRRKLLTRPLVHTPHAIAMIIDDESPMDEDFTTGFQHLAVLRQRNDHLGLTGLPYRVYLLSDLERDNFPKFRAYLLPNLFRLTKRKQELIRQKLMRDGSILIFGPGTGISDGKTLSAKAASDLLGIPLELIKKESARRVLAYGGKHLALIHLRGPLTYGDSYVYGPILQPVRDLEKSGAVELGKVSAWWYSNRAGLVLKEFGKGAAANGRKGKRGEGDYAVVFSMAVPIPAGILRSLALYAGCNPWSELGDVVAANGNMLAVHSVRPGRRTLRLPKAMKVIDAVTGKTVRKKGKSFKINLKSPDTRVFLLE